MRAEEADAVEVADPAAEPVAAVGAPTVDGQRAAALYVLGRLPLAVALCFEHGMRATYSKSFLQKVSHHIYLDLLIPARCTFSGSTVEHNGGPLAQPVAG